MSVETLTIECEQRLQGKKSKGSMGAYLREHGHKESLMVKVQRVEFLKALIKEWEESPNPDWIYIFRLQEKLKKAEKQLEHMRP